MKYTSEAIIFKLGMEWGVNNMNTKFWQSITERVLNEYRLAYSEEKTEKVISILVDWYGKESIEPKLIEQIKNTLQKA